MNTTPSPSPPRRPRDGFTLIELLTVIAIIGILAAILIPVVGKVRESAKAADCSSNLRQIGALTLLYVGDNKGRLPSMDGNPGTWSGGMPWQCELNKYRGDVATTGNGKMGGPLFTCRTHDDAMTYGGGLGLSYGWAAAIDSREPNNPRKGVRVEKMQSPTLAVLAGENSGNQKHVWSDNIVYRHGDRANFVFVDGHVTRLTRADIYVDAFYPFGR